MQCQSAEGLGRRLKCRYDRQRQRQGPAPLGERDQGEVAERLDRLLGTRLTRPVHYDFLHLPCTARQTMMADTNPAQTAGLR
jgi:hypothetical protein